MAGSKRCFFGDFIRAESEPADSVFLGGPGEFLSRKVGFLRGDLAVPSEEGRSPKSKLLVVDTPPKGANEFRKSTSEETAFTGHEPALGGEVVGVEVVPRGLKSLIGMGDVVAPELELFDWVARSCAGREYRFASISPSLVSNKRILAYMSV